MPTLHLTRGLPASGKSTWARALVASRPPGSILRVNRDDLRRSMVDPDYATPVDAVERRISAAEWRLARGALRDGVDVVVDATNLRSGPARRWLALAEACGAGWHLEDVVTDLEECVRRDAARPPVERLGEDALRDLAARFLDPDTGRPAPLAPPPRLSSAGGAPFPSPAGAPAAVLVVVEGLGVPVPPADPSTARPTARPAARPAARPDAPAPAAVAVLGALADAGHRIIACSARPEDDRASVASWLAGHLPATPEAVLLRPAGDRRAEERVLLALVDAHVRDRYAVTAVIEGRPRRAQVWRDLGLAVVGVSDGEV